MRLYLLVFLPLVTSYHTTDQILSQIRKECDREVHLSCNMHGDILVVDWKQELPRGVVWTFNEHARERITAELALEMVLELKRLSPKDRVTIVPIVNVWGRKEVEAGRICTRKNKNGVDPNRNYPPKKAYHYARYSEEYEGPHPLSEPETQLVSNLLVNATRYVNVHSGEYSLYMPWDSLRSRPPNFQIMRDQLERFRKHCKECRVGPAAITSFYRAFGTSVDYAIQIGVPEAYTFEIFGARSANCAHMFNPIGNMEAKIIDMWKPIMIMTLSPCIAC